MASALRGAVVACLLTEKDCEAYAERRVREALREAELELRAGCCLTPASGPRR